MNKPMNKLRRIQPVIMPKAAVMPKVEDKPVIETLFLHQLVVSDEYQRKLSDRSMTLIRKIAREWDWRKFHVPVVTLSLDAEPEPNYVLPMYEILDGQHTCIAALTNGSIRALPCQIVTTADLQEKAESFVGLNTERVQVTPLQIFWAKVAAKDEDAIDVVKGAEDAGASIISRPPPYGEFAKGEVAAVKELLQLANGGGRVWVKRVLEAGVALGLAPINQVWIRALSILLVRDGNLRIDGDYSSRIRRLVLTVNKLGVEELYDQAMRDRRITNDSLHHRLAYLIYSNLLDD